LDANSVLKLKTRLTHLALAAALALATALCALQALTVFEVVGLRTLHALLQKRKNKAMLAPKTATGSFAFFTVWLAIGALPL
jgi:DNA polymerase III epsilon subunit-like protein